MKKLFFLLLSSLFCKLLASQNVGVGTTSPEATLHIKGSSDITQLIIDANAVQSNIHPLIRFRDATGEDLLHLHADAPYNVFVGVGAGRVNSPSNALNGWYNTFIGSTAGYYNTSGYCNTAVGRAALFQNTTGQNNTSAGFKSLWSNTAGNDNTAIGSYALSTNTLGKQNTAHGALALRTNTIGTDNTAIGFNALFFNNGGANTAVGVNALYGNVNGTNNTSVGNSALSTNGTGINNTAIGSGSDVIENSTSNNTMVGAFTRVQGANSTAIGYGASVNASNKVRIGNTNVTVIEGQVAYAYPSDARFKYSIHSNVPGLSFITKLTPVTYYLDEHKLDEYTKTGFINNSIIKPLSYNEQKQLHTGFLAQDVEKIAKELGYQFDGIHTPANDRDHYSLAYSQFIMPLVKAVQEQQKIIDDKQQQIDELKARLDKLEKLIVDATGVVHK